MQGVHVWTLRHGDCKQNCEQRRREGQRLVVAVRLMLKAVGAGYSTAVMLATSVIVEKVVPMLREDRARSMSKGPEEVDPQAVQCARRRRTA